MEFINKLYDQDLNEELEIDEYAIEEALSELDSKINLLINNSFLSGNRELTSALKKDLRSRAMLQQLKMDCKKWKLATMETH